MPAKPRNGGHGGKQPCKSTTSSLKKSTAASGYAASQSVQPKRRRPDLPLSDSSTDSAAARTTGRRRVTIRSSSETPITPKSPTSYASRKRRRPALSIREVLARSSGDEEAPTDHAAKFAEGSIAQYTWGIPTDQPIMAIEKKRRHPGFKALGFRRGKQSAFEKFMWGEKPGGESIKPFPFMELPLEIRWNVYKYLLIYSEPILAAYYSLLPISANARQHCAILRVSKQIYLEGTRFFYEKNTFHALIPATLGISLRNNAFKRESFLSYLKNVVIESGVDIPVFGYAELGINSLIMAGANLDSFTVIQSPKRYPNALALMWNWGSCDHRITANIQTLRCKFLIVVIRLLEKEPDKERVVFSIDLRGLPANQRKGGWLAKDEAAQLQRDIVAYRAREELSAMKLRVDEIYQDHEKVIREGKARFMDDDERVTDGMRLVTWGQEQTS